jgi:hypothetical protein
MELLTVQDAAERMGVSAKAIYYSLGHGKLTTHRQYGKILVDASELALYKPRSHPSRAQAAATGRRVLTSRGMLTGLPGSVDEFLARKHEDTQRELAREARR